MYYTLEKTAEILELQPGDVNRLREQGKLRAFRDGANWKFRKEDVEKYLTDLIRERSKPAATNLLNDSDEELPTMLADSASFDSMIDASADAFVHNNAQDDFALDNVSATTTEESDDDFGLNLAPESDDDLGLTLAPEDDDLGLTLAPEEPAAPAQVAAVFELEKEDDSANVLDGAPDDDALHLGSDSGLALLDDVSELDGSNVGLGDDGDVLLGGSSGSGSALNLGSDSGLALLDDAADDFALDAGVQAVEDDGGIFELAKEPEPAAVLELEKDADADAATVLNVATEEGFQLGVGATTPDDSLSESGSQSIPLDAASEFFTVDDEQSGTDAPFDMGDVGANPFEASESFSESNSASFAGFGGESDALPGGFGGESASFEGGFVSNSAEFAEVAGEPTPGGFVKTTNETEFTGKDFAFLVPCFIFLLVATIGAYELTRTIWSYENGSFDFGGPLLEMLAKMVKLVG